MVGDILLFGWKSEYTLDFVQAATEYFDASRIVLYVFGKKDQEFTSRIAPYDLEEVIWDHDVESSQDTTIDLDYLRRFEEKHGYPNLWRYLASDRKMVVDGVAGLYYDDRSPFTHEELLSQIEVRARRLESMFRHYDFDFIYGQQIMRLGGMLIYGLSRSHSIPFFRASEIRIKNNITILEDAYEYSPELADAYQQILSNPDKYPTDEANRYIERVRRGAPLYDFPEYPSEDKAENPGSRFSVNYIEKAVGLFRLLTDPAKLTNREYYYDTSLYRSAIARIKKLLRQKFQTIVYNFDEFDPNRRYVYFPLQVQPELSLMVWSRFHNDFPSTIRNVAQSLPVGVELYVNEHPVMSGVRPAGFYDRLRRLPNVRVVPHSVGTGEIITHAEAVICVTTSTGLEALMHEVPVVTLGEPAYAMMNSVQISKGYDSLTYEIRRAKQQGVNMEEVTAFVSAAEVAGIPRDHPEYTTELCRRIESIIEGTVRGARPDSD